MSTINQVIRSRKSVYPAQFIEKSIPKEIIEALLINANHAPTHKLTEPWRFKVFLDNAKNNLGLFLAEKYKETATAFSDGKYQKIINNCQKSAVVLAIILHRDPQERVPEWEELASVSMAVQNIWLGLNQYELGGYWSSPPLKDFLGEHVSLMENETCFGFFYLGYCEPSDRIMKKGAIEDKVEWVEK